MVTEGEQIAVGDTDVAAAGRVSYEVLCRRHHRRGVPSAVAAVALFPEPLPFEGA